MGHNNKKVTKATSIVAGLGFAAIIPAFAVTAGLTNSASATGVSGNVQLDTEVSTSIAMKIASPNDTNPDCMEQSGVTYGVANRYATSNGAEGSKQVDTFDGTTGGADEVNTNTSCATLTMTPNTFSSTYSDVTIYTNSPTGYALTVRSADNTSPNLVNTTDSTQYIEAGALTESDGTTPGGQNKWAIKSDTGLLDIWTPVATTDTTVRSYDMETNNGSTTRVTYGISAGNNVTGKYATTLTYTATMFDGENTTIPSADITADDDAYKIDGASSGTIKVPYNETRAVTISPTAGYYLTGITCTSPYTCGDINGDPLVIPANNTNPVTVYITNTSKTEAGTIIISTTAIEYPVSVAGDPENEASSLDTSTSNLSIPYGSYRTVTVAPAIGYYLDSVNCPDGYSCTATTTTGSTDSHNNAGSTNGANKTAGSASPLILGNNAYATGEGAGSGTGAGTESPVQTGEDVTYAQDVKVKNDKATKGGALTFATKPRNFTVSISSDSDLTTTSGSSPEAIDSLTIIYGHSKNITVTPATGHYLASISCPEGYVCTKTDGTAISTGDNEAARAPQNIRISNDRSTTGGTLALTSGTSEYTVSASATNATVSTVSLSIPYGGSKTLTVTPATGYYLSSYSCPEGYSCTKSDDTTISTGDNATAQATQTIKVTNNNTASGGSLTFTGAKRNIEVAITPNLNATTSTNLLFIPYGESRTVTIIPNEGYFLKSITCSSGYTCSGYSTGFSQTEEQAITITNNNTTSTGVMSFVMERTEDYMQGFSADKHKNDAVGTQYTVKDYRDNQTYTAAKLADGNIWMTKDLKLDGGRTLTPADSNVSSNFNLAADNAGAWCTTNDASCVNQSLMTKSGAVNGYYYNWYAATAGSGTYSVTSGEAAASICPKGWTLPTVLQFYDLYAQYGSNIINSPYPQLNATSRRNGSAIEWNNESVYWTSTSSYNESRSRMFDVWNSGSDVAISVAFRFYGQAVRCVITTATNTTTTVPDGTMQSFSASAHSSDAIGKTYHLKDTRDNMVYGVRKSSDGKFWMLDGLKLDGGRTLTPADSNVSSNFTLRVDDSGDWCTTNDASCINQSLMTKRGSIWGYYYNWYAATAGSGTYNTTSNATASICPKGWALPTTQEQQALFGSYNGLTLRSSGFTLDGYQYNTSAVNVGVGTGGNLSSWSRTAYDTYNAYGSDLYIRVSPKYEPSRYNQAKYYGLSIHCVSNS